MPDEKPKDTPTPSAVITDIRGRLKELALYFIARDQMDVARICLEALKVLEDLV